MTNRHIIMSMFVANTNNRVLDLLIYFVHFFLQKTYCKSLTGRGVYFRIFISASVTFKSAISECMYICNYRPMPYCN